MRDFVLMTDSCCDLTDYMANDLALEVLPLTVHMAGRDYPNYLDGRALSREAFYHMLRGGTLGTTSAVNIGAFEEAMSRVLSEGKDIVCVCFSGALSTTYQSAVIAARDLISAFSDSRIYVIDSLCASLGQGLLLYLAAEQKRQGKTADQTAEFIENTKGQICHWITADDLHYLKMGGRVSSATALLGTMLSVKPVLHMDGEGRLIAVARCRGRKAALKTLLDSMEGNLQKGTPVFIAHADCETDARLLAKELHSRFGVKTVFTNFAGPVVGSHAGPNAIGLFYLGRKR